MNEHVHFIQNSHSVNWGDDSNVLMLVDCFNEILNIGKRYDYFQICTGQDMMVQTGIDDFLEKNNGKIYIDITKNDKYIKNLLFHKYPKYMQKDISKSGLRHLELVYTLITRTGIIPRKHMDYDVETLDFYASYNWCYMPYEVLSYIHQFLQDNPGFLSIYRDTRVPEDGFLGTIIRNSPYRDKTVIINGKGQSLTYTAPMDGCHMQTLKKEDIQTIEKSGCFMARKFDYKVDPEIVKYFHKKIIGGTKK